MRKFVVLIICFMFIGVGSIFAEPAQKHVAEPTQMHAWELGTEISYIKYEEPGIMEETGAMWGLLGSYTYRNRLMLRGEGHFSFGQVDYDGQLSNGTPYTISGISDYIWGLRGLVGYDFPIEETSIIITPYFGFGYRYLNDDTSFDPAGYERESNYFYSPIGIEVIAELEEGWSIGGTLEYDIFWKGIQKSHLEDFNAALDTLENDQNHGYGIRGSIKIQNKKENIVYITEPFIRYWNIEKSEKTVVTAGGIPIGVVGWEPENSSFEIGIKFAVRF